MDRTPETCSRCGSTKAIEQHHISYNPPILIPLCRKCHQAVHNIEPVEGELVLVMRQYDKYTKLGTSIKNWKKAWSKDFSELQDDSLDDFLKDIKLKQRQLLKEAKQLLGEYGYLQDKWRGVSLISIAYILAFANPKRFPSLRKFLFYCGRTEASRKLKNYNHLVSGVIYNVSCGLLKAKNEYYYPLYLEIKESFDDEKDGVRHGKALNRIGTLWLKEVYNTNTGKFK